VEKRNFITFLILSMGVLLLAQVLFPPAPPPKRPAAPVNAEQKQIANKANDGAPIADAADDRPLASPLPAKGDAEVAQLELPAVPEEPLEYLTLGSLDRESGYRMLVTLTNKGAAVHRAELASPRFRDLHDRTGYPGHLYLEPVEGGLQVGLVGPGTPAAKAGIKVGDVITAVQRRNVNEVPVETVEEFSTELAKTDPWQEVTFRVRRGDDAASPMVVKLARKPLEVMRPEIENIRMRDGRLPDGFDDPPSFLTSLATLGDRPLAAPEAKRVDAWLQEGHWKVATKDERSVTFERAMPAGGLVLIKRYSLQPVPPGSRNNENYPAYNMTLDVEIRNDGQAEQSVAYRLDGPTGLPIEGWWYTHKISRDWFATAGLRDVVVRFQNNPVQQWDCSAIATGDVQPAGQDQSLAFVGVDAVYFSCVLVPVKKSLDDDWFDATEAFRVGPPLPERTPLTFTNVSCRLTRDTVQLAPGASQKDSFTIFVGPKRPELLAQYQAANDPNYSLKDIIYYGMWPFSAVARGMLSVLHFFYGIVGNFGIAIIMLTIVVRGALLPISFKQTSNMARMQALKPELDRITEKYKTDMQKRSQAMQELYRKHNINPLGGCLPVFLQLPIFMGLYRSLMIDVELRQRPLFSDAIRWCSDLSAPDMFYDWAWLMPRMINSGEGLFSLGPYLNILPLVTVGLFLVSMKMTMPEPTNEQGVMQQKMMKYMTIFMGLLFYKVASGLCIYFIASSLWGLGERHWLNKSKAKVEGASATPAPARVSPPTASGQNGSAGKKAAKAKRKR
jgi:YidC/Oxa1 family membrane protein insertase